MTELATSQMLLDAAEGRFAAEGIERASLRAVMRDAEADPGAVHYHFGGREPLAVAVLQRILGPLNARRLSLLSTATSTAGIGDVGLDRLVEAIVRPDIEAAAELNGRGAGRAKLIGSIYLNPAAFVKAEVERHFAPVAQQFMPHLMDAVPDVPASLLAWRVRWFVFGVVGALMADDEALGETPQEQLIDQLVITASAAISAPKP